MGLFDLFKGKNKDGGGGDKKSNPAAKWAEAAGSKRAQNYDRQEAIAELCKLKTPEAVEALLRRFTFSTDPSITDEEEKEAAYEGIVSAGRAALEPVRAFAAKAESLSAPMRVLKELLPPDELVEELLVWLERWDTDYAKFIDPKLQILSALEDYNHPKIREGVQPFLEDVSEPARFHAVATMLAQKEPEAIAPLLALLLDEESVRIRAKVADGFVANGWEVPDDQRDPIRKVLPHSYGIDGSGHVTKRGG
jgi:HEAT repeat protein